MIFWLITATNGGGGSGKMVPTSLPSINSQQSLSNQSPTDDTSSQSITPNDNNNVQSNEFTFQMVHEAFGREIMQDLKERKRLKELTQRPLIEL